MEEAKSVITKEGQTGPNSPYIAADVKPNDLGLSGVPATANIRCSRYSRPVENLETAKESWANFGVAILDKNYTGGELGGQTVAEVVAPATEEVAALWAGSDEDKAGVITQKDFESYNGTGRHMQTISPQGVLEHLPLVVKMQQDLLPLVRAVTNNPSVEVSEDPDEGTVVNLQVFAAAELGSDHIQQHGAHTDRVDVTVVTAIDNIGPNGELVFIEGYTMACENMGLNPHLNFAENIAKISVERPETIEFRIHPVVPGEILILNTDKDVHFITQKSGADVQAGLNKNPNHSPVTNSNGDIIGRAIINTAFESGRCREVDSRSRAIEDKYNIQSFRGAEFFDRAGEAISAELAGLDLGGKEKTELSKLLLNAMVTRMSADDLYHTHE